MNVELRQLGRFSLTAPLGQGGMGTVYLAHDPELGRDVAIKVLRPDTRDPETSRSRLMREAKAMARLAHPNVITVHEVGRHDDDVFVVMEHVAGGTLGRWLATPRSWRAIVDVIAQVADGLVAAHGVGLIHRDIKPDNILIGDDGRARITDFGLVGVEAGLVEADHATDRQPHGRLTHTGMRIGTIGYMAPEQIEGRAADERSDQFGLCATAYEALAGVRPFKGETYREIALATTRGELAPPRHEVPEPVLAIVRRGLAVAPSDRWPDLAALAAALRGLADDEASQPHAVAASPLSTLSTPGAIDTTTSTGGAARRGSIAAIGAITLAGGVLALALTRTSDESSRFLPPTPDAPAKARQVQGRPLFDRPGCASDPTFVSDDELVFAYKNGDSGDLYLRDLARDTERRLTSTPALIEHHPQASRGERTITFVAQEAGGQGMWAEKLSLVDGTHTTYPSANLFQSPGAAWIRDRLYYVVGDGGTLIGLRGETTSEVFHQPSGGYIWTMAPSADGRQLVLNTGAVCVLDLDARPGTAPSCVATPEAPYGRYVIDPTGALYYGAWDGIHAIDRTTAVDRLAIAGAGAAGGMDVSPTGTRFAWSDCQPQITLTELGTGRVVHRESLTSPVTNRLGAWVFVRETPSISILSYREPGGHIHELTTPKQVPGAPALEPTGERIVFARDDAPGLYLAFGVRQRALDQLTDQRGDTNPVWIDRERLAFTRPRADGKPEVWTFDLDRRGERDAARRAFDRIRQTADVQPNGELVLLMSDDRTRLYLWNPKTGDEREIPQPAEFHSAPLAEAELSPDAKTVVVLRGTEVWRWAVTGGPATRLWLTPTGHQIYGLEVDADDHVIVGDAQPAGTVYVAELR